MGATGILLAYAGGLCCAPLLPFTPVLKILPLLLAPVWLLLRRRRGALLCLAAWVWSIAFAAYHLHISPPQGPPHLRAFLSAEPLIVEGTIESISPRFPGGSTVDLRAHQVGQRSIAAAVEGRIRLLVENGRPAGGAGDRLRFRARLRAPRTFGTPGEFDYPRYLAARNIYVTAFVPDAREIAVFPGPGGRLGGLRERIGKEIDAAVAPSLAPLVRALVIGDKGGLAPEQRDLLGRGGISHLFAISGLHLGLIALILFSLARHLYCRSERLLLRAPPKRFLPVLLLPLLYFYLQLTGDALPTRRAFLMAAAGALFLLWGRRTPPLRLVAAAALVILAVSPLAWFEPSFQLSFAGVLGIVLLLPAWQKRLQPLPPLGRWPLTLMATTFAATLATAPLVLMHFHQLAPAGLLLNLAAVPAIGFLAVPLGLLGAAALAWWPAAAAGLFRASALVIETILDLCTWTVSLPWLAGWTLYLPPLRLAAVFALSAALLMLAGNRRKRWGAAALGAAVALALLPLPPSPGLTVTALSVGQGEAVLLTRTGGRHYLVDGGGLPHGNFDTGERLVAPALARLGVERLEAVVLSHDHPDHRLGLLEVLAHFPVGAFWTASPPEALDPELQNVLQQRAVPVRVFPPGWTQVETSGGDSLAAFAPVQRPEALNDASLVLRAGCGRDSVLLTGDLEAAGIRELLAADNTEASSLVKIPHHGSRRSAPAALLEAQHPQLAFVCLGYDNPYRFPHPETVAAAEDLRIPLFRTDLQGTVRFRTGGSGWQARQWRAGLFR